MVSKHYCTRWIKRVKSWCDVFRTWLQPVQNPTELKMADNREALVPKFDQDPEEVSDSESVWNSSLPILEKIFANLELDDICTASLVSKSWSQGATKALENRVASVIKNAHQSVELDQALRRFHNYKTLDLNIDQDPEEGSLPVLLSSVNKDMPFLTSLNLRYEATKATLCLVNGILAKLTNGHFPKLQRLELFPLGEANLSLNPNQSQNENKIGSVAASSLQVLRVRFGHLSTLALDWEFARHLSDLSELHILELCKSDFGRQIEHFFNSFKENVFNDRLKMDISFQWPEPEELEIMWPATSTFSAALQSLLKFVNPFEVSLIVLSPYAQAPHRVANRLIRIRQLIPLAVVQRFSLYLRLSEQDLQDLQNDEPIDNSFVASAIGSVSDYNPNMAVLVRVDIDFGNGRKTFFEVEKHSRELHLSLRYGPKFDKEEQLHDWGGRFLARINKRPLKDFKRRLESRPKDVGGKIIKCSLIDLGQKNYRDDVLKNPQKLPWKRVQFSEPEPSLRAFLIEKTRYSKILEKNVPVCTCELYSVN